MRFKARVGSEYADVSVTFGDEADVRSVGRWRASKETSNAVRDAIEFARLASKRWRYYRRSIPCIRTLDEFIKLATPKVSDELCLILMAKAKWFSTSQPLGLAQCRRTFCNHLVLEFLSVHPKVISGRKPVIRGIGSGLIYTLAALADLGAIPKIWGEATAHSAPFYERVFEMPDVKDQINASSEVIRNCASKFKTHVFGTLEY